MHAATPELTGCLCSLSVSSVCRHVHREESTYSRSGARNVPADWNCFGAIVCWSGGWSQLPRIRVHDSWLQKLWQGFFLAPCLMKLGLGRPSCMAASFYSGSISLSDWNPFVRARALPAAKTSPHNSLMRLGLGFCRNFREAETASL